MVRPAGRPGLDLRPGSRRRGKGLSRRAARLLPTPLTEVPAIASELGVGRVFVKDESARMGLAAFKVLGASWAVHQVLSRRPAAGPVTLVAATDGNHGRALAWMARLVGQRAHIFVPSGVHPTAVAAISAEGARVTEITGSYDDAVRLAAKAAGEPGAELVQDAGWPGYEQVPGWIVDGYSTLFAEVDEQLAEAGAAGPALVVIPAGVGSLAQAGVTHYRSRAVSGATSLLTVEPGAAACVLASLVRGAPGTHHDRRYHHGRVELRHPLVAGLAVPARWPGRGGRRGQCRRGRGSSRPGR